LRKKGLLMLLVLVFLCACTFIGTNQPETGQHNDEHQLLNQFDEIVKKAEDYSKASGSTEVQSVYQHETDLIWKIEFTNGLVVFYDEETGEMTHTE
jgi:outer membrane biogenesis lipoprotein LolB